MTPDEALAEYHRVIAEYDATHRECPIEKRQRQLAAERQERQRSEVRKVEQQAIDQANWDARFDQRLFAMLSAVVNPAVGQALGETSAKLRQQLRKEYETKIAVLETRLKDLERQAELNQKFHELELRLDARQQARGEAKRGSEMIPQSQLLPEIDKLQHQLDGKVAGLDGLFRELAERLSELEKTNSLEARFTKLAHEVKGGSENPQGELLQKFEALERRVDDLKKVADPDARFRELAERVGELETTTSLEARFTKFADEVKRGSEPRSDLLVRIDGLQRQFDDLKKIANRPGPQGPPGPPGKLPLVREYVSEHVHYQRDVVTHVGALWQALGDTVHPPPHSDWICIARAGRDGSDGRSPNVCGTYDAREEYERLDIVALDGAAFIARRAIRASAPGSIGY